MDSNFVKLIALSVTAMVVMSGSLIAQTSKLKNELISKEKQSWEAWQKRDGKFFANFLSDDHVEVSQSGIAVKAAIVAFVGNPICKVNDYKVDQFTLTLFDSNTALLTYRAEQNTVCGSARVPSPAWASSLYKKRGGRWLNALYQQTPITR